MNASRNRLHSGALLRALLGSLLLLGIAACTAVGSDEDAVHRGDAAFAAGDFSEALAEYRLAIRQGSDDVPTLVRAAHAYARVGRIDEARSHYERAIRQDPAVADIAAADLLRVARIAVERNDGIAASAAVEAAMALRPGVSLAGLALPLARHFSRNARYGEALPFYQKAITEDHGNRAEVIMEMAMTLQELGDCQRALVHFEEIRSEVSVARRSEVDWHVGNCSFLLAREAQDRGDNDDALRYYRTTIDTGEPRSRMAQAWFQTGEILAGRGQNSAAIAAFEAVLRDDSGEGQFLQQRARERIDQIRFPSRGGGS
jgi:tetratricopeptide (TPR) repeat protein